MKKLLPPTHLLRAFLAVAEFGSVARAAEGLHLTPGAVSKQIAELERWLAVPLFDRVRKKLVLTPAATGYRDAMLPAIGALEAATLDVMRSREGSSVIHFGVPPTISERWLDPLLPEFTATHPGIELRAMSFVPYPTNVPTDRVDAFIGYGRSAHPDLQSEYLLGREIVVIAPPRELMARPLSAPADLRHFDLVHHEAQPEAWAQWCAIHGVSDIDAHSGPQLTLAQSIISAVAAGVGVALMPLFLVVRELADGRLSSPFPPLVHQGGGYYLCFPSGLASAAALGSLRSWLLEQARRTPLA
jgi:LysR family transcriptional regulator, glycine cleavage system transcriptional activator